MFHGFNAANNQTSCCKWGRANGWIMMAHVEVLLALEKKQPHHPLLPQVLALFQNHSRALLAVQSDSGAWHQVLNETSTFLETSCTAMFLYSYITGIQNSECQSGVSVGLKA